jgi:hypothetical protein
LTENLQGVNLSAHWEKQGTNKPPGNPSESKTTDSEPRGLSGFEFQGTSRVITLQQWIEQEGAEGRRGLFEAIKAEYPKFTQVSLTNYIRGHRIPEFKVAKIISKVTGIPIFLLSFRLTYKYKMSN